jgi:hypothetical protein
MAVSKECHRKIITFVAYNRPAYTARVIEALRRCEGIEEYEILGHVEPGCDEVIDNVRSINFAPVHLTINAEVLGIGRNTYAAWENGFAKADFIVHIEDDTMPAQDCLALMEHCGAAYREDAEIFSVASYNRAPCAPGDYFTVVRRRGYTCWLVGTWRNRWAWARGHWSPDPRRYATHLAGQTAERNLSEVYPLLSRSQNIGAEGGFHVHSAAWHRKHHHTEHWAGNYALPPGVFAERKEEGRETVGRFEAEQQRSG